MEEVIDKVLVIVNISHDECRSSIGHQSINTGVLDA